jgi:hypothetical protein
MQCDPKPGIRPERVDFCSRLEAEFGSSPKPVSGPRGNEIATRKDPSDLWTPVLFVRPDDPALSGTRLAAASAPVRKF